MTLKQAEDTLVATIIATRQTRAIEVLPGGGTFIEGQGLVLARFLQLRSALSLECKGIMLRRGFSALKVLKAEYGIVGTRPRAMVMVDAMYTRAKARAEAALAETV